MAYFYNTQAGDTQTSISRDWKSQVPTYKLPL